MICRVGEGAGKRDEEAEFYALPGQLQVSRETVHHAAYFGGMFFLEDLQNLVVGITIVDDQRLAKLPGQLYLGAERGTLLIARRAVAVKVETGLADGDDFGVGRQSPQFGKR